MDPSSSYSFSSEPRAVKAKYRPPADETNNRQAPQNIHFDPRVSRGCTYSSNTNVMPEVPQQVKKKKKTRVKPKDLFSIKPDTQKYVPVPLEQYLIEQTNDVETREQCEQTDAFKQRFQPTNYYTRSIPKRTGVDASTQIEPEDGLFDFDLEVTPLLNVIINKTLEVSLMEVEEEEELKAIRAEKENYMEIRRKERQEIAQVEKAEHAKFLEKEELKKTEKARVWCEFEVNLKVASNGLAKILSEEAQKAVFNQLKQEDFFYDPDERMVDNEFMPWLYAGIEKKYTLKKQARELADCLLHASLKRQVLEQDVHWLQNQARMASADVEEDFDYVEPELPEGFIRIFLEGKEGSKLGIEAIGPIPVNADETMEETEKKIEIWLKENIGEYTPPDGGFLKLAYGGKELSSSNSLLSSSVPNDATLEVLN